MDKIFDLLDVAIAVMLLVVAFTVQIHSSYSILQGGEQKRQEQEILKPQWEAEKPGVQELYYLGNGVESLSYLHFLNQDEEQSYSFAGKEYDFKGFCEQILKVEIKPELNYIPIEDTKEQELLARKFKIYRYEQKWRIEEI